MNRHCAPALAALILGLLTGCGGGGGSSDTPTASSSTPGTSASAPSTGASTPTSGASTPTTGTTTTDTSTLSGAIAALDASLPADPGLPASSAVCTSLAAALNESAFSSPSATDPAIDNAAALALSATNSNPDTARIQAALNACGSGKAVKLVAGANGQNAFLAGALNLPSGVTLWIDEGITLNASRYPADFTSSKATSTDVCGDATASTSGDACKAFITLPSGATNSGVVGKGTIDGRGGSALTGGPKAGIMSWWDVALLNKVSGYSQNTPNLLDLSQGGSNFTLSRISLLNSPHFHVKIDSYNGFTAWGVKLLTPSLAYSVANYACASLPSTTVAATAPNTCYTPDTTKNTDGIDPGGSNNVTIAYSYISVGDDNVAVTASNKGGGCTSGDNGYCASTNTKIAHNWFYYGHGMSVGSGTAGGVSGLQVWDLAIDGEGSSNGAGLRIKSYAGSGGSVSASYTKVCLQNEKQPIWIDPYYSSSSSTTLIPNFHDISLRWIHVVSEAGAKYAGGTISLNGHSAANPLSRLTLDNVYFDTAPSWGAPSKAPSGWPSATAPNYASFVIGSGSTSFAIPTSGSGVTVSGTAGSASAANALDCSSAFVKFPRSDSPI